MAIQEKKERLGFKRFLSSRGIFKEKSAISRIEFEKRALKKRYIAPGKNEEREKGN